MWLMKARADWCEETVSMLDELGSTVTGAIEAEGEREREREREREAAVGALTKRPFGAKPQSTNYESAHNHET